MRVTNFQWLKTQLEDIERRVSPPASMNFPGADEIRPCKRELGGNIQAVALDGSNECTHDDLPVVIAVGLNYTQGDSCIPRSITHPFGVVEDLSKWRRNVTAWFSHYKRDAVLWKTRCLASDSFDDAIIESRFHFVMTNFCCWITNDFWGDMSKKSRSKLLNTNPQFDGQPSSAWNPLHLFALSDLMHERQVVWIGHGLSDTSELPGLFSCWKSKAGLRNWLLTYNVTYPPNYSLFTSNRLHIS